ncbi:telomere repeat-binding factor 1 [Silene latifolia]|uniref:telomere repeat-binding factor 1 n=1 Tax=Silene latifolia TaxID=37657 RepID=UPI003D78A7AE
MGAPKQKWTAEEEAALKAGVIKHGSGKWRTILKDPEFSGILYSRSNVDLKDKWRNMCVMPTTSGSREKSKTPLKRVPVAHPIVVKQEENPTSTSDGPQSDEESPVDKPMAASSPPVPVSSAPKRSVGSDNPVSPSGLCRLDNLILEAITNLKEPEGSNKTAIASYIEDQYWAPPDFKRVLSAKLKFLTSSGKLVRVNKRNYQIPPYPAFTEKRRNPMIPMMTHENRQMSFPKIDREDLSILKSQIDLELAKMRSMTPQEAAAAAARAVAEAESAIALAEEAAREAEEAEADAEAAQSFAAAATKMLRGRSMPKMMRA